MKGVKKSTGLDRQLNIKYSTKTKDCITSTKYERPEPRTGRKSHKEI